MGDLANGQAAAGNYHKLAAEQPLANTDCTYFKSYIRRGKPRGKITFSFICTRKCICRSLLLWPVTGKFARVKLIEESVGGEVYEGRNKEPWI